MSRKYQGCSLFNDVEDPALRTWNRCVVMLNLNKDEGEGAAVRYAERFSEAGRMQVMAMYQYIAVKGAEIVRLEISQGKHSKASD